MRIFKHKNMMGLIYSILIAIPFLSVLSRSAYAVFNKNAYQSYSGDYGEKVYKRVVSPYNTNEVNSLNDLHVGSYYLLTINKVIGELHEIRYSTSNNIDIINFDDIRCFDNDITGVFIYDTTTYQGYGYPIIKTNNTTYYFQSSDTRESFNFIVYINSAFSGGTTSNYSLFSKVTNEYEEYLPYEYVELESQTLDNAFEYSLSSFVDENHWGKLNFFEWFTSLFLDVNSNNNGLYIHFINWYMNYTLFVSCAYILFMVLMWFINFARRLLDRGINYDW